MRLLANQSATIVVQPAKGANAKFKDVKLTGGAVEIVEKKENAGKGTVTVRLRGIQEGEAKLEFYHSLPGAPAEKKGFSELSAVVMVDVTVEFLSEEDYRKRMNNRTEDLIQRLGNPFERDNATRKLTEIGKPAIPLLMKKVLDSDPEISRIARKILIELGVSETVIKQEILKKDLNERYPHFAGIMYRICKDLDLFDTQKDALYGILQDFAERLIEVEEWHDRQHVTPENWRKFWDKRREKQHEVESEMLKRFRGILTPEQLKIKPYFPDAWGSGEELIRALLRSRKK